MNGRGFLDTETIARLTVETDPWLSCDDCFDGIDTIVDEVLAGRDAMPEEFRVHLRGCPVCREEAEALATLVAADHGVTRFAALATIDDAVEHALPRGRR